MVRHYVCSHVFRSACLQRGVDCLKGFQENVLVCGLVKEEREGGHVWNFDESDCNRGGVVSGWS